MSTITNRIMNILKNEMHVGQFHNSDVSSDFLKIDVADLDLLAENVATARAYLLQVKEEQQKSMRVKLEEFLSSNKDLGVYTIEDLLVQLANVEPTEQPKKAKATTKAKDNNTRFEVTLFNPENEKHETFVVVNKILRRKITQHPAYVAIVAKDKTMQDVDNFLRAYSPQFAEKYPINAKWKKKEFHINDQGKLNKQSQAFFDEYLKEYPENNTEDFRSVVKTAYKKP